MGGRITVGSVAGVEVRIHRSWLLIALLVAWSFWGRYAADERGVAAALAMAVAGTLLFFASVLTHELAHSLEARHRGVEVSGITLFLFGGATETRFDVERPRDEFALTAVGPFSSFVLGAAFGLVSFYSRRAGLPAGFAQVAGNLAWINLALGVFNLLPGAPLDGGRILRSAVWAITDDRGTAVTVASRSGQVLGWLIAALGLWQLFFVPGGFVNGLWFAFIGWFLANAARSELIRHRLGDQLEGLTVGELAERAALPTVTPDTDLDRVAATLRDQPQDAVAVLDGDRVVGLLTLDDVADVSADQRAHRRAGDVATPADELPTVAAETDVGDALEQIGGGSPLAITDPSDRGAERVRAVVTTEQLQRVLQRSLQLGGASSADSGGGSDGGDSGSGTAPREHLPGGAS